jgi:hypothetical protein
VSIRIVVNLTEDSADTLDQYGAGAKLYLLSASSEAGSYADVTSTAIVSGTEVYELTDAAGTSATWYKTQTGTSAGSPRSRLSAAFQATAWAAYAHVDDVLDTIDIAGGTGSSKRLNLINDLLLDMREELDRDCGRTFLRVPQVSGTVTFHCDIVKGGQRSLVAAMGHPYTVEGYALDIVSITSLRYRDNEDDAYATLGTEGTDWWLEPGYGPGAAGTAWPYEDITLSKDNGARTTFATGKRAVEGVGVLGFPAIPSWVRRATIDRVRDQYRAAAGNGPAQSGVNQFGVPVFATGMPESYRRLLVPGSAYLKRVWR